MSTHQPPDKEILDTERDQLLERIEERLEVPMVVLGLVWLMLLIVELVRGLTPLLELLGTVIWIVFILDFLLRLVLASNKSKYLKQNWLTMIALLLPALRVLRAARAVAALRATRAARGVRLARVVTSMNRGMRALSATMSRRGFGYVVALTLVVTLAGSAGMYAFENQTLDGRGLRDYGTALWWTAMVMTTMGSEYWPQSPEGRLLCLLLAIYAFAVWGYVTATIATFFIGRDAENEGAELAGAESIRSLHEEVRALRQELRSNTGRGEPPAQVS